MLEQNRFQDAGTLLQPVSGRYCDYRVNLLRAASFEGSGDIQDAESTLQQAHAVWPLNISIAVSLARYYLRAGNAAKAERVIGKCAPRSSTPLRELQMMAMVYLENHDLERAKSVAVIAYQAYPSEETLLFAANVLQLQGRYMDVVTLLQKSRTTYSDSVPFLVTIAESESSASMYGAAHQDLEHAIALNPGSYMAHYLLGYLLVKTGDIDGGIREYQTAVQLSPQQPRTYQQLGLAWKKKGDDSAAQSYFEKALSVDSRYAPAYCEIGRLQIGANQLQDAVENLSRAVQYNPSLQESYYLLVQAYARLGEKDKSQAVMKQWTAFRNSHPLQHAQLNPEDPLMDAHGDLPIP